MKLNVRYLYFVFASVFFANVNGQHFPTRQYMTADGMPFDIAQHPSGVMWFMTKAGPTYYDTKECHSSPDSLNLPASATAKNFNSK